MPGEARATVEAMLTPTSLAIITVTLGVWAGSHFFGVGEVVDVILGVVGAVTLGWSVFEGARELYKFAKLAINATSDSDLDEAGKHFARAVTILGISTVQAVLLHGQVKALRARGAPEIKPRIEVGDPPPSGNQLRLTRPKTLPNGDLGITDEYGVISISRDQLITEQRLTLYHELVHRFFSPRTGPLRKIRAELNISSYDRSALLQY